MVSSSAQIPGLYFRVAPAPEEPSPLRTDIAGFVGRTRRGPVEPVRVDSWAQFERVFGSFADDLDLPHAVYGYFDNGGEIAYVARVGARAAGSAEARWQVGPFDPELRQLRDGAPRAGNFSHARYRVSASTPGEWSDGTEVRITYRRVSAVGWPTVDIEVRPPNAETEYLFGLDPKNLPEQVAARSAYIHLEADSAFELAVLAEAHTPIAGSPSAVSDAPGPAKLSWQPLVLSGGSTSSPSARDFRDAAELLQEIPDVALVVFPDLYSQLPMHNEHLAVLAAAIKEADHRKDQLVVLTTPDLDSNIDARLWIDDLRAASAALGSTSTLRAAAVYHPGIRINRDPLDATRGARNLPSGGHVTGVISRLDRERGAHYTPANAPVWGALDSDRAVPQSDQVALLNSGINLLRCIRGQGLQVWGGRTLDDGRRDPMDSFLSFRRLIHRLVRAIRRVAEPLVFDNNGPEMWLTLVRGITTVLLEAYRANSLKGRNPAEAFRVTCDATTNPPDSINSGRVVCEIALAPSVPMEFITLRIALGADGRVEAIE